MTEVVQFGIARPRLGVEYSAILDRGEAAMPGRLSVTIVEGFVGGQALRVGLESSNDGSNFVTLAEGKLLLAGHLFPGQRLLDDVEVPPGGPRYLRLRFTSTGQFRLGTLFGGIVPAATFSQLGAEQQMAEDQHQKPGAEVPTLPPGQQPFTPNVWDNIDRGPEPAVGNDDVRQGEDA